MAMLVVLLDDPRGEFSLSQDLVTSLAQLGVTNAALVRDEQTAGIVLEGRLFDPARSADAAAAAVGEESTVRVLHPVVDLASPPPHTKVVEMSRSRRSVLGRAGLLAAVVFSSPSSSGLEQRQEEDKMERR